MIGDSGAPAIGQSEKSMDWAAEIVQLLVAGAKASKEDSTYGTYMQRRLRAVHAVTSRQDPESIRNFTAPVPSFDFAKSCKGVHRFGGGIREICLATVPSFRASTFGIYAEAGRRAQVI